MRIVLTHPFCWPYVRRGSERFIAELAQFLTRRGHEVVTVSGKPGRSAVEDTADGRRILHAYRWHPALGRLRISPLHTFVPGLTWSLARLRTDVVHSLAYFDAWAANKLRRVRGFRTVYQVTGPVVPAWFPRMPPDRFVVRSAIRHADRCVAHSEFTADIVRRYYGVQPAVIPVPVDLDAYTPKAGAASGRPIVLCMAAFDERRKGLRVLVDAFTLLKRELPDALLRLSGRLPDELRREVIDGLPEPVKRDIEILGMGSVADLPRLYREASVTVVPSMWEAYGMAVVESWACGTPVVVTRHGGLPELVCDARLGRTFEPLTEDQETRNASGLAEAIVDALPLARDPATATRCRERAELLSWERLGPEYESLYSS